MKGVGPKGLALIKEFEGLRLKAYLDGGGVPTIGYGHVVTMDNYRRGLTITEGRANCLLRSDCRIAAHAVEKAITVPLTQEQFDALVSFTFNVGVQALMRSTLRVRLNRGDYAGVPHELARWRYDNGKVEKGLVRRRAAEAALWSGENDGKEV